MRLVKAAKASPHAKIYNLSTDWMRCSSCGRAARSIAGHIKQSHGLHEARGPRVLGNPVLDSSKNQFIKRD